MPHSHCSLEDLVALLERITPTSPLALHDDHVHVESPDAPYDARVTGSDVGRVALSFVSPLGRVSQVERHARLTTLLESAASSASVRVVVDGDHVALETRVVLADTAPAQRDEVVRWHLMELVVMARAWRRRLGLTLAPPADAPAATLDALICATPVVPQKALLVAAVGFAVAGVDGRLSHDESERLRVWLREVPSFASLDRGRVVAAIATLVGDTARALHEARRHLTARERLLAWALANDMAHADGFSSPEEQRYLATVASVFELSPAEMQPLLAEAQERAIRRETPMRPPACSMPAPEC